METELQVLLKEHYNPRRGCFSEKFRIAIDAILQQNTVVVNDVKHVRTITPEQIITYFKDLR